ncbi:NTP transferase domain-containing protein [bacterium]|nr:NTP transferase domain-containing protein [bacterium]
MQAVIMAGGFGTRLHPLTYKRPKPMVPLVGKPMMEHIVNLLMRNGFREAISLLYYHGEMISSYFGDGSQFGIDMRYKSAEADLGTVGSVKNAADMIEGRFIVISADVLTDFDLQAAVKFHKERNALATIVLTRHPTPLQFGIVITDDEGRITRFLEKPAWGQVFSDTINTGIYILEPEVLDWVPKGQFYDFSKDLFPRLLEAGEKLYGYIAPGYWRDVGNLREYRRANEDALWERVKLDFPGELKKFGDAEVWVAEDVEIEDGAQFEGRVLLGRGAKVGKGAYLKNTVVGANSLIAPGANIEYSVLWDNVSVGVGAQIENATIASDVKIGDRAQIEEHCVIADGCSIGDDATISAGVKIWPDKTIEDRAVLTESLIWTDRVGGELFTKSRISGVINWELSPEFVSKIGAALGAALGTDGGPLVISRDPDRASQITARALFCGAMSAGLDVEDLRIAPIPTVRQYLAKNPKKAGVHIRKSPYYPNKQDLIFFNGDGTDLPTKVCRKIEQLFMREGIPRAEYEKLGRLTRPAGIIEDYRRRILEHIDIGAIRRAKFKIVMDYQFGAAAQVMPPIHERVGAEVLALNAYVDPNHLTKTREEREQGFRQLAAVIKTLGADVGFAIDPVGERLTICDDEGNIYQDNKLLYLVTKLYLMHHTPETIAVPISATMGVNFLARDRGVRVVHTRDEHLAMMEAALNPEIPYVGGTRGGFIFTNFGFACDAMFAAMKILELLARTNKPLSEIAEDMPDFKWVELKVQCPWHAKGRVMRRLIEYTEDKAREVIDGVRVIRSNAWVLVLPDAEFPVFHLIAEGKTEEAAKNIAEEYAELIEKWQREK